MHKQIAVSFFLAVRMLLRSGKGGTLLTILIIALVFTNMIFLSSIIAGSINLFHTQTRDYCLGDIVIRPADEDESLLHSVDQLLMTINRVPGVIHSTARLELGASLSHKGTTVVMPVISCDPADEVEVTQIHTRMKEGSFLQSGDRDEIVIGNFVAGNTDRSRDIFTSLGGVRTGDLVCISFVNGVTRQYRIKGIFSTKSYQADYQVFITRKEMQDVLGEDPDTAQVILVRTARGIPQDEVKTALMQYGVKEQVTTWQDESSKFIGEAVESFSIINDITLLVSLIIAVVVLFIVIMIKTINNRRQIATMKAIGINRETIILAFVIQVLIISIIGIIIGTGIIFGLSGYFAAHPIEFPDGDVYPVIITEEIIRNAALLVFSSAVAGYLPAYWIAREPVISGMRGGG